jgi:heme exporter protein D
MTDMVTHGLGPHAAFILASYAATILIIGALTLRTITANRAARRRLAALDAGKGQGERGPGR